MAQYIEEASFGGTSAPAKETTAPKYIEEGTQSQEAPSSTNLYAPRQPSLYARFEDETVRPEVERKKLEIREALKQGAFRSPAPKEEDYSVDPQTGELKVTPQMSPAGRVASSLVLPPWSGLRGIAEAGASFITELPRIPAMGAGAIGGGLGALSRGGNFFEGAEQGAHQGSELVKNILPSGGIVSKEGATARALFEIALDDLNEAMTNTGGRVSREVLSRINPIYNMLPDEYKTQIDAVIGSGATGAANALPFLFGGRKPQGQGGGPTMRDSVDALRAAEQKKALDKPVEYISEAEFLGKPDESTPPSTFSEGEAMRLAGAEKYKENAPIQVSKADRELIMGTSDAKIIPGLDSAARPLPPKRNISEIPLETPEFAPRVIEKTQEGVLQRPIERSPHELSGRPGSEGLSPEARMLRGLPEEQAIPYKQGLEGPTRPEVSGFPGTEGRLNSFNPAQLMQRLPEDVFRALAPHLEKYGEFFHPTTVLRDLRSQMSKEVSKLEQAIKAREPGAIEAARKRIDAVGEEMKPVINASEYLRTGKQAKFRSFNPSEMLEKIKWDGKNGLGAVPLNQDVAYFGYETKMPVKNFLELASPLRMDSQGISRKNIDYMKGVIEKGDPLGQPWFQVEWNKNRNRWEIVGHEGRHRATAIRELMGEGAEIPVHIFPRQMRARDLSDKMKEAGFLSQDKTKFNREIGEEFYSFHPLRTFTEFAERLKEVKLPGGNKINLKLSSEPFDYEAKGPFNNPLARMGVRHVHGEFQKGRDFVVEAKDANGNSIGYVEFKNHGTGWVEPKNVEVVPHARNQKVMTSMYDYAKEMGYKVMPSLYQSESGRAAWSNRTNAGKDFWSFSPIQVAKDILKENPSLKGFEKALVENYGEDIRVHAKNLYAYAKQEKALQKIEQGLKTQADKEVLSTQEPQEIASRAVEFGAWDRRTGDQFKKDLMDEGSKITDLPDSGVDTIIRLLDQGQKFGRNHPILNWVYSKLDWTERDINRTVNEILYGQKFVEKNWHPFGKMSSLRKAVRDGDPDSMMYRYNHLKDAERLEVVRVANKYNGVREPTELDLRGEGLSKPQIEAYQHLRKGLEKYWDEVLTPMANKLGIALPDKIPGYFPMSWFGDYRVWGKHKVTGERWAHGAHSLREAKAAIEELSKRFPEFEFKREDITNTKTEFNSTPEAFLDAIRLFGRNSETGKALYEAMTEITMRSGASRHRMARNPERTHGYAGEVDLGKSYAPGRDFGRKKQLIDFERSVEGYIEQGVRYAKNKETLADLDVALKDQAFRDKFPNAVGLAETQKGDYLGESRFLDASLDRAMQALGQSTNLPKTTLNYLAGMVMYAKVMMLRAPFYAAQALQGVFIEPRLVALQKQGLNGNIIEANAKGMFDWLSGKGREADIQWAVQYGVVDPKFAEQITFTPSIRGDKPNVKDRINTLTGNRLSAAIDQSVRLQAYLVFLNFAESAGMPKKQAREIAARNSLDVMVEYESWKRAPMFRHMGTMGQGFSPLTTFTNNLLNRLTEYAGMIPDKKTMAPLATIAATYLFLSGLYGFPFRQDIDKLIDLVNEKFGTEVRTPTDFLIQNHDKLGDAAVFGVPSAALGMQIGGSLGSPEILSSLVPMYNDPVPQYAMDNLTGLATLATKGKSATEAEKMALLKAAAPTAPGHGLIENYYSPQNRPRELSGALPQNQNRTIPLPNMEGGPIRNPSEQVARLFGMRSLKESSDQIKRFRVEAKQERQERVRTRAVDNIVDGIILGKGFDNDLVGRYIRNGGNPDALITAVENKVENRLLDARTRTLGKLQDGDYSDFNKLKLLEEFKLYVRDGGNKKMAVGDEQSDQLGRVTDDGGLSSLNSRRLESRRGEQQGQTAEGRSIIAEAKRLYPNSLQKQKEFMDAAHQRYLMEKAKTRGMTKEAIKRINREYPTIKM